MKKWFANNIYHVPLMLMVLCITALPAHAASTRLNPETGYAAEDIDMTAPYDIGYSGGLDVVYANVSSAAQPTRAFVHGQIDNNMTGMDVQLYNYDGQRATTIYSCAGGWPQVAKKIGNAIWFSYSGGAGSGYYSVPWDETLASYPAATATAEVISEYNWEVEESQDGDIFVCGATGMGGGHSIGYVDTSNSNNVIPVVNIGGNSSGFAVDSDGNIWSSEYILDFTGGMHIEPCRLGMWSKADVDAAIAGGTPLEWSDASVVIPLGTTSITGETTNWGPNDIEMDNAGNIYLSMNTYNTWDYTHEYGRTVMLSPNGSGGYTLTALGSTAQRTDTNEWDWARGLAFDGNANLNAGGYTDPTLGGPSANILYLDMDMGTFCNDIDQIVAISIDSDFDNDGVPDAVDNAPETANTGQEDSDGDGYGNIVDADFDNNGSVDFSDYNEFKSQWLQTDPVCDMNSDGSVDFSDYNLFKGRWLTDGPWY